jgi:ketosteroid isomerase-like protein
MSLNHQLDLTMRTFAAIVLPLCIAPFLVSCTRAAFATESDEIIRLERAALDRWGRGDPTGFLDTYAQEVTYFDPGIERRLDGHKELTDYYRPLTGMIKVARYEMLNPKVQQHGNTAVLSYNLRSDAIQPDGKETTVRWNSTSVYVRVSGEWKTIHSHWSLTAHPSLKGII